MAKFEIDADPISGVAIVATTERLTLACMLPSEIDACVTELKVSLDKAAEDAKATLWGMKDYPDFPVGPH